MSSAAERHAFGKPCLRLSVQRVEYSNHGSRFSKQSHAQGTTTCKWNLKTKRTPRVNVLGPRPKKDDRRVMAWNRKIRIQRPFGDIVLLWVKTDNLFYYFDKITRPYNTGHSLTPDTNSFSDGGNTVRGGRKLPCPCGVWLMTARWPSSRKQKPNWRRKRIDDRRSTNGHNRLYVVETTAVAVRGGRMAMAGTTGEDDCSLLSVKLTLRAGWLVRRRSQQWNGRCSNSW